MYESLRPLRLLMPAASQILSAPHLMAMSHTSSDAEPLQFHDTRHAVVMRLVIDIDAVDMGDLIPEALPQLFHASSLSNAILYGHGHIILIAHARGFGFIHIDILLLVALKCKSISHIISFIC